MLRPVEPYSDSVKTSQASKPSCESPAISPREFLHPNGTESFEVNQSTSTRSSPRCTLSSLMRRERDAWERLKSCLPWQNLSDRSKPEPNGPQPSEECRKQLFSSSPIEGRNYMNTQITSKASSRPNMLEPIPKSSYTTSQSVTESEADRTSCLLITSDSETSARPSFTQTGLNTREEGEKAPEKEGRTRTKGSHPKGTSARDLMVKVDVASHASPKNSEVMNGMRPKYLRYNIWDPSSELTPNTSDWTLTAEPLEGPPQSALDDEPVTKTIRENPHLFKVVTPICVDVFEAYLTSHPNQDFVRSVCRGLREGFWPWAVTPSPGYPIINDESRPAPTDEMKAAFLRTQRDFEVAKGRFSPPFKRLLPGMYCMPIYAIPKPHSSNLHLVTDHSYGKHSLNSMIKHDKVS